jgi:DNA replication protein DnaC
MAAAMAARTEPEVDRFRKFLKAVPDRLLEVDHDAEGDTFEEIVGRSAALKQVLGQVVTVAPTGATALILGETGTGKELIARAIHRLSLRKDRPFITLNCAAIPTGLLEIRHAAHRNLLQVRKPLSQVRTTATVLQKCLSHLLQYRSKRMTGVFRIQQWLVALDDRLLFFVEKIIWNL